MDREPWCKEPWLWDPQDFEPGPAVPSCVTLSKLLAESQFPHPQRGEDIAYLKGNHDDEIDSEASEPGPAPSTQEDPNGGRL